MAKSKEQQAKTASPAEEAGSTPAPEETKAPAPEQSEQPGPVETAPPAPVADETEVKEEPKAPEQGEQTGPAEAAPPAPAPEEEAPELKLYTLEELAEANRVPGWQSAALHKLMGWEPGKRVRAAEYKAGLARLKSRRIGG
jgi:hypothetical protein